jgi:acyl-CoA thioesterase-1
MLASKTQEYCYDSAVSPLALYFASGESLYSGAMLLLLAVLSSLYEKPRWLFWLRRTATWLGLAMIVMASPPFPWVVDAIFAVTFLLWFIAANRTTSSRLWVGVRIATMSLLLALLIMLPVVEFSRRRMPSMVGPKSERLVVIGDSISAGLGAGVSPWPSALQQLIGIEVRNLSRPGATTADGIALADGVNSDDHLVLIELGGNDLLAGEPSVEFARKLDAVLSKLALPGRTLVMFELPLLPPLVGYGQIQRRLAAKYSVVLIPKRYLTQVISGSSATSDGLHLSEVGTRRMASVVMQVLRPVLKRGPLAKVELRSTDSRGRLSPHELL